MSDSAILAILRRQIAEGSDGLGVRIVDKHLFVTAKEIMKIRRLLFSRVWDVGSQLRSTIHTDATDDGLCLSVCNTETQF